MWFCSQYTRRNTEYFKRDIASVSIYFKLINKNKYMIINQNVKKKIK